MTSLTNDVPLPPSPLKDAPGFQLTNTGVEVSNGRMSVSFTRTLLTGTHPIVPTVSPNGDLFMFASGTSVAAAPGASCLQASPRYHGSTRGYHPINWFNPDTAMPSYRSCK